MAASRWVRPLHRAAFSRISFPVGQALAQGGLLQDFEHALVVATFSGGFLEGIEHFLVVDEFLGVSGLGVIHDQN